MTWPTLYARERLGVHTILGIRFWDPLYDAQVRSGLRVTAWRAAQTDRVVHAFRTRSDIYAFQNLPGLRDLEYATDPNIAPLTSPFEVRRYIVQVEDLERRFLPVASAIDLPLPYRGAFPGNGIGSPPGLSPPGFLLFSAASRQRPYWMAGIRGELQDLNSGGPARHAKIQVRVAGRNLFGLSDMEGRFAIHLPYPNIAVDLSTSPPPTLGIGSVYSQSWPVEVEVFYQPDSQIALPSTVLPDYLSILTQPLAQVRVQSSISATTWTGMLEYGRELKVTTLGEANLLVSPAQSSP